ncbi:MAG: dihydrofolate reductase family protein [Micropruina sp.]|nr:MAG: dihydrofolate reductase family protein [Micropruina sp.]
MSLDGRITLGPHDRLLDPQVSARWDALKPPGFAEGPGRVHAWLGAQVTLQGSGSFVDVDAVAPDWPPPRLSAAVLRTDHLPREAGHWFVVADGRGRVDWSYTGDETTRLHLLVCQATPLGYLQRLRDLGVGYFIVGDQRVDLAEALSRIAERFRPEVIALDGGGVFNAAMLRAGLVDELDVLVLPGIVGGAGTPTLADGPVPAAEDAPIRLELLSSESLDGVVRLRYRVR